MEMAPQSLFLNQDYHNGDLGGGVSAAYITQLKGKD